jgi:hypothetical protein
MHIAILTFDGFNEIDSVVAPGILNRVKNPDWRTMFRHPDAGQTWAFEVDSRLHRPADETVGKSSRPEKTGDCGNQAGSARA